VFLKNNFDKSHFHYTGDPDSLVHYDMGQALAWDGVEKSGVKDKFLTDKAISAALHEDDGVVVNEEDDKAIAVRYFYSIFLF
jgi:hypothetical protein